MNWLEGLGATCQAPCAALTGHPVNVFLPAERIVEAARRLHKEEYFIEDVTCLDVAEGHMVLYHFDKFEKPGRVTLRVVVPRENSIVPSIAHIFHGAEWHERECMDFYPVTFSGNPNPSRLLLPADMEEKVLAKDAKSRVSFTALIPFTALSGCVPGDPAADKLLARQAADKTAAEKAAAEAKAAAEQAAAEAAAPAAEGKSA